MSIKDFVKFATAENAKPNQLPESMVKGGPGSGRHAGGGSVADTEREERLSAKGQHEFMRDMHAKETVSNGSKEGRLAHANAMMAHQSAVDAYSNTLRDPENDSLPGQAQVAHDSANQASIATMKYGIKQE